LVYPRLSYLKCIECVLEFFFQKESFENGMFVRKTGAKAHISSLLLKRPCSKCIPYLGLIDMFLEISILAIDEEVKLKWSL